jgi:hypothetical protein
MREFNEFKFNVNVEYKDEFGQDMSQKDVQCICEYILIGRLSNSYLILFTARVPEL